MSEGVTDRLVLDGSLALAWYFADEADAYADAVARGLATREAVVPSLWRLEVANALVVGERRKRSTQAQAAAFLARLECSPSSSTTRRTLGPGARPSASLGPTRSRPTTRPISSSRCGGGCRSPRSTTGSRRRRRPSGCRSLPRSWCGWEKETYPAASSRRGRANVGQDEGGYPARTDPTRGRVSENPRKAKSIDTETHNLGKIARLARLMGVLS